MLNCEPSNRFLGLKSSKYQTVRTKLSVSDNRKSGCTRTDQTTQGPRTDTTWKLLKCPFPFNTGMQIYHHQKVGTDKDVVDPRWEVRRGKLNNTGPTFAW